MLVSELIAILKDMPPVAEVEVIWDGEPRTEVRNVHIARNGKVMLSDYGDVVYSTESRPIDAPTWEEDMYWSTPKGE